MKRIATILSLIFIGTGSSLHAQNSMFDLGLEGGPNLSTILMKSSLPSYDPNPKTAVYGSGGFIFQYNFKNFLSIKTGFSYQRKGYQLNNLPSLDVSTGNMLSEKGKLNFRMDYLTFPVLVKASFGKKVNYFVNAGPYGGYLLQLTDRTRYNGSSSTQKDDPDKFGVNRWDFGIAGGIGIAIPIRTYWVVSAEIRNYTGLIDIAKNNNVQWHTNTTDLRIGVAYKLGFYKEE
jgi:hypothetical protein